MDYLEPVFLARLQFALTIMFHYLFPPLTIGLGVLLVWMEGMYIKTGDTLYQAMAKFWGKIFGLTFALGVASGIVMEFQFGTNWATYSRYVGDVFGSALAAEGIFAFFLESGFLAVMLFGWNRVSKKVHFFSTVMVSLGAIFSAVWIIVANSWQQTPAGHHIVVTDGVARAEILHFWAMVFNPSSVVRLVHTLLGAFVLGGFLVMSVGAYYVLKKRHEVFARKGFVMGLALATVASLLQLPVGHWSAIVVAKHQPAKLAAFEGVYETRESTPLYLFGIPDDEARRVRFGLPIPGMLSFLVYQDFKTPIVGLDQFPREDWPPVQISFQTYHVMVSLGFLFIGVTLLSVFLLWRGTLFRTKWLMAFYVPAILLPYVANHFGWIAAEVGRQPWVVYGLLRTSDAVSKTVTTGEVLGSLLMFGFVYFFLFLLFIYLLDRKIRGGPEFALGEPLPKGQGDFFDRICRTQEIESAPPATEAAAATSRRTTSDAE